VRHREHTKVPLDAADELQGAVPRAAAGAVSDRDERRTTRTKLLDRAVERFDPLLRLGREELEGEHRRAGQEQVSDSHGEEDYPYEGCPDAVQANGSRPEKEQPRPSGTIEAVGLTRH
jgi:hypothetical protein